MKTTRSRFLAMAAFGFLAVSACANTAAAQTRYEGKFTLPNEVRWQGRVMPAGDYTLSLNSIAPPAMLTLKGPNGAIFVPTMGISDKFAGQKSSLRIVRRGGIRFVEELYLAGLKVHLCYSVPKAPKEELLAQGPSVEEYVLIASAKK
jgi:hypothetical protein